MTIIDANKFLAYLIFSHHINGMTYDEAKEAIEMCKVDVLERMRAEIAEAFIKHGHSNTEICFDVLQIIDKYREGGD